MGTLWAVLRREIWERRQVVWLGLFLGVLCPLFANLPGGPGARQDVYEGMALGVSASFFLFMSLIVGLGLFASDQVTGRVGFYLARPVRPWQLLVGRVLAAVLVLLVGSALVAVPTLWWVDKLWLASRRPDADMLVLALWLAGLLLAAAHVLAVALRLRGRWTLFDLGALAATGLLFGSSAGNLNQLGAQIGGPFLVLVMAGVLLLAAALGVWTQLRHGGTQRGRLHAAFSLVFWSVALAAAGYQDLKLRLAVAQDWDDVQTFVDVMPSNDGKAAWLQPSLPRPMTYLLDVETGRRFAMDAVAWYPGDQFPHWWEPTLRGRTAMWLGCDPETGALRQRREDWKGCGYKLLDLDAEDPRPVAIPDARGSDIQSLALDRSGRRLAQLTKGKLRILDAADLRPIHQIDLLGGVWYLFGFHENGSLLALVRDRTENSLATVRPDGSSELRSLENSIWNLNSTPEFLVETGEDERWLVDSQGNRLQALPKDLFSGAERRMVGDWVLWVSGRRQMLEAIAADGRRLGPITLDAPPRSSLSEGHLRSRFGPPLFDSGRSVEQVLVSKGWHYVRRVELPLWARFGPARLATLDLDTLFRQDAARRDVGLGPYRTEEQWTTHLVDLGTAEIVASFDGFRVLPQRIETPSGPEAWLVDGRGMPHRLDPARLDPENPIASLEPVFEPPWSDGE